MSLFDLFRRRPLDTLRAVVVAVGEDGATAKPLPTSDASPYALAGIPRRIVLQLGLKPGELVDLGIDARTLRTWRARRVFPEPPRRELAR